MIWPIRYVGLQIAAGWYWLLAMVGYWVRPCDMLADRRRWRWQPAQRCGFPTPRAAGRPDKSAEEATS